MEAMVVYETMFGNTRRIARAIADGLALRPGVQVTLTDVVEAPVEVPAHVDLIVAGGPTHAFSMSRESTRRSAVQQGAVGGHVERGIREWLQALPSGAHSQTFAAFDTRVDIPLLPGAASRRATRAARRLGFARCLPRASWSAATRGRSWRARRSAPATGASISRPSSPRQEHDMDAWLMVRPSAPGAARARPRPAAAVRRPDPPRPSAGWVAFEDGETRAHRRCPDRR